MRLLSTLALGAFVLPVAAQAAADRHSYAQPREVVVHHIDLNLKVDFPHKQLDGVATLTLDWKSVSAQNLVLDTENLKIASVDALDGGGRVSPLKYELAAAVPNMGSKLTIVAPKHPHEVRIAYTTSPDASGLQWLTAAQTAGKKLPFLFSQSEATHARSWIPLMR